MIQRYKQTVQTAEHQFPYSAKKDPFDLKTTQICHWICRVWAWKPSQRSSRPAKDNSRKCSGNKKSQIKSLPELDSHLIFTLWRSLSEHEVNFENGLTGSHTAIMQHPSISQNWNVQRLRTNFSHSEGNLWVMPRSLAGTFFLSEIIRNEW